MHNQKRLVRVGLNGLFPSSLFLTGKDLPELLLPLAVKFLPW
jgi:hypothetical protein